MSAPVETPATAPADEGSDFLTTRRRDLGGGVAAVVVGSPFGGFRVSREVDGARTTVIETPHPDEARSVFDHLRAVDPPWHPAYLPTGKSPPPHAELTARIHAVGRTVEECCATFAESLGDVLDGSTFASHAEEGPEFQWLARFSTRAGAGFKASGRCVPGGYVMTWWK